jgi:hypothetical protein
MHSDPNLVREGEVLVVTMPGGKVLERYPGLHPSDKEHLEWCSITKIL